MNSLEIRIDNFSKALSRLEEVLAVPDGTEFKIDVCVKRFEFTYEMCWKAMQSVLKNDGMGAVTVREVFEKSKIMGLIENDSIWLQMKEDRNDTSHEYNENKAAQIARRVPAYAKEFKFVLDKIKTL